jgi:hypothetical protein
MLQIISIKVLRIIRVKHEVILNLPIISGIKYKTKTGNILQRKIWTKTRVNLNGKLN